MEVWKKIKDTCYEISDLGNVRNSKNMRLIKCRTNGNTRYLTVFLRVQKKQTIFSIHRLVAETFIPNTDKSLQVNHKNGVKTDNRLDNLEWVTRSQNMKHMYDTGLKTYRPLHYKGKTGFDHNKSKSVVCKNTGEVFGSISEAARALGIDHTTISLAIKQNRALRNGMHFEIAS